MWVWRFVSKRSPELEHEPERVCVFPGGVTEILLVTHSPSSSCLVTACKIILWPLRKEWHAIREAMCASKK